jgi:hypothetical protein
MPQGLAVPVGVGPGGGMRTVQGAENDNKIVSLSLGDCSNGNAFQQDLGFGVPTMFETNDPSIRTSVMINLRRVFDKFKRERRYELVEDSVKIEPPKQGADKEGANVLQFKYLSLESNEERTFSRSFISSLAGFGDQ